MMDAKLAASTPGPDLKIQIKQGGKSDKATAGEGKAAFRDTLDERLQSNGNFQGRLNLKSATDRLDETRSLDIENGGADETAVAESINKPKKPVILLSANGKPATLESTGRDSSIAGEFGIHVRLRTDKADRADKTGKDPATLAMSEGQDEDPALLEALQSGAEGELPLPEGEDALRYKAMKDTPSDSDHPADDKAGAAAKDALVLLREPAERGHSGMEAAVATQGQLAGDQPSAEGEANGRSAVYRVVRADGRGQQIDVETKLGADEGDRSVSGKTEVNSVVVVEQRRFLAPVTDNALSIAGKLAGDPEWSRALQPDQTLANAAAQAGGGKVVNTLKIQLHPIELGLVTATLRLRGDELSVELKVDNGLAYRSLKDDQTRIVEALKAHGFAVDQVNVSFGADRADSQGTSQQNGQSSSFTQQQQQARDGGQNAPTARERGRFERERNDNGTASGDDLRVEAGTAGGTGSRQPGHVYL